MTNENAMLTKTAEVYAYHGLPLECDIYDAADYPEDAPAVLYFHPGGLVDWGRDCLAPWLVQVGSPPRFPGRYHALADILPKGQRPKLLLILLVQVCFGRKWPLVSPSYRLLPQVGAKGLLDDVTAAYEFAKRWRAPEGKARQVIVSGASGGA
jgi:acetyl esterase/lipase